MKVQRGGSGDREGAKVEGEEGPTLEGCRSVVTMGCLFGGVGEEGWKR